MGRGLPKDLNVVEYSTKKFSEYHYQLLTASLNALLAIC